MSDSVMAGKKWSVLESVGRLSLGPVWAWRTTSEARRASPTASPECGPSVDTLPDAERNAPCSYSWCDRNCWKLKAASLLAVLPHFDHCECVPDTSVWPLPKMVGPQGIQIKIFLTKRRQRHVSLLVARNISVVPHELRVCF